MGTGPATLKNGLVNPLARGFLLADATVGLIRDGSTYAVVASGQVQVIGISNLSLNGEFMVQVNQFANTIEKTLPITGTSETVDMNFDTTQTASGPGEAFYNIAAQNISIVAFEQSIIADLALHRITFNRNGGDENAFYLGLSKLSAVFSGGEQDLLSLTDAEGDLLIFSDGIAADFSGKLDINVPDASAIGKYSLLLNTTGNIVNQSFVVAGDTRVLKVDAGPFIRIVGQGVILEIDGQNLEGNFGFEQNSAGEVFAQLTEVRAAFSEGRN